MAVRVASANPRRVAGPRSPAVCCAARLALALVCWGTAAACGSSSPLTDQPAATIAPGAPLSTAPIAAVETDRAMRPVGLAISGGVSLGAYEAGVVWALTRYLRDRPVRPDDRYHPELRAVAGASAGGINTVLAALTWCTAAEHRLDGIEDNLLYTSWQHVGLDALLPAQGGDDAWHDDDGLFSRRAFDPVLDHLRAELARPRFRPGCALPLTLMLTSAVAVESGPRNLEVPNLRFAVPLVLRVGDDGMAWFENDFEAREQSDRLGASLYLPTHDHAAPASGQAVPTELVLELALATSAFPVAFSPRVLPHCVAPDTCPLDLPEPRAGADLDGLSLDCEHVASSALVSETSTATLAAPPTELCWTRFIDGGVFDNTPLGATLAQVESMRSDRVGGPRSLSSDDAVPWYVYVDPDIRRHPSPGSVSPQSERGTDRTLNILEYFVGAARKAELHNLFRYVPFNTSLSVELARLCEAGGDCPVPLEPLAGADDTLTSGACEAVHCLASCLPDEHGLVDWTRCHDACASPPAPTCDRVTVQRLDRQFDALRDALVAHAARLTGSEASTEQARRVSCAMIAPLVGSCDTRTGGPEDLVQVADALATWTGLARAGESLGERVRREHATRRMVLFLADYRRRPGPTGRTLHLARRFSPLAAEQLGNFGAFLDPALRRHDYYAGIYDAVIELAQAECESDETISADCIATQIGAVVDTLEIADDRRAFSALVWFADLEQRTMSLVVADDDDPSDRATLDALARLRADPQRHVDAFWETDRSDVGRCDALDDALRELCVVALALTDCSEDPQDLSCVHTPIGFQRFAERLNERGHDAPAGTYMARILDSAERDKKWWIGVARIATRRLESIEAAEVARTGEATPESIETARVFSKWVYGTAGFLLRSYMPERDADGSRNGTVFVDTVPPQASGAWHLIPYELAFDLVHGGALISYPFGFAWEPAVLSFAVAPVRYRHEDRGVSAQGRVHLNVHLPWWPALTGLGLFTWLEPVWTSRAYDQLGLEATSGISVDVASKLRLSGGLRWVEWDVEHGDPTDAWAGQFELTLSVIDLPGLAWWLGR